MSHKEGQDQASMFLQQLLHKNNQQVAGNGHSAQGVPTNMVPGQVPSPKSPFEKQGPQYAAYGNNQMPGGPSPMVRGLRYSDLVSREHAGFQDQRMRSYAGVARVGPGGKPTRDAPVSYQGLAYPTRPDPHAAAGMDLYHHQHHHHAGPPPQPVFTPTPAIHPRTHGVAGFHGGESMEADKPAVVEQVEQFLHTLEDSSDSSTMRILQESSDSTQMRGILHGSTDSAQLRSLLGNLDDSMTGEHMKPYFSGPAVAEKKEDPLRLPDPGSEVRSILSGLDAELDSGRRGSSGVVGDKLPLYLRSTGQTPDSTSGASSGAAAAAPPPLPTGGSAAKGAGGGEEAARPMSYAGALRSRPPAPSPQPPPHREDDESEPDPLDLLKNLNIKASPGTQALYQYFS